jgi:hypothetical protein
VRQCIGREERAAEGDGRNQFFLSRLRNHASNQNLGLRRDGAKKMVLRSHQPEPSVRSCLNHGAVTRILGVEAPFSREITLLCGPSTLEASVLGVSSIVVVVVEKLRAN